MRAGADFDRVTIDGVEGTLPIAAQVSHVFTSPGTVSLACRPEYGYGSIKAFDRKITAHRVGTLTKLAQPGP